MFRHIGTCYYCTQEGRRTELDAAWMKVQNQLIPPGYPLACREHLLEQQQELRESKVKLAAALRKRQ